MQTTEAQDELYGGADLHGNNVFLTLCDRHGQRVMERRVKANLSAVNQAIGPYWERVRRLAVESTYNWYWLVDGLRGQGRDVRLARNGSVLSFYNSRGWLSGEITSPHSPLVGQITFQQGSAVLLWRANRGI